MFQIINIIIIIGLSVYFTYIPRLWDCNIICAVRPQRVDVALSTTIKMINFRIIKNIFLTSLGISVLSYLFYPRVRSTLESYLERDKK